MMGKFDKDRFQKEMAVNYCLAQRMIPFIEVVVRSTADLSDSVELLTDIDVLGVNALIDGGIKRTIFDCKTTNKMSSINRAFWAAGLKEYTKCEEAYIILKNKAVHNHRMSALSLGVDLHDEESFRDLGRTIDPGFPTDEYYQSSMDRWNLVFEIYARYSWSVNLYDLSRNSAPLSASPTSTFRRILAELRNVRGHIDPSKREHLTIMFDVLSSMFVLWATIARDIRRIYEPTVEKLQFEKILRYYIWGGKDSYNIRQQMQSKAGFETGSPLEFPGWDALVSFVGLIVSAPQNMLECAHICRELSLKCAIGEIPKLEKNLKKRVKENGRLRQFSAGLANYMTIAGGLPRDIAKEMEILLFEI